jgi:hypothetical protein
MRPFPLMPIVLAGALLAPKAGFAQISCSREGGAEHSAVVVFRLSVGQNEART